MVHSTKFISCLLMVTWATCVIPDEIVYESAGVAAKGEVIRNEQRRLERDITKETVGFNSDEKNALLDKHNKLRRVPKASNMLLMEWDSNLEKSAQIWAEQCKFSHSPNANRSIFASYNYVGENIFTSGGAFDLEKPVQMWYDEVKNYVYSSNKCALLRVCGHYTQVVWADSRGLGCGIKYCVKGDKFSQGYIVVCQYGPSGNFEGQKPYKEGNACSECPKERQHCLDGLCAAGMQDFQARRQNKARSLLQVLSEVVL